MQNPDLEPESSENPSDPISSNDSSASTPTESLASSPDLTCPYCGREAKTERGLNVHISRAHKGQPQVDFSAPQREVPGVRVEMPPPPPSVDLAALEKVTADNIEALGQLLHVALRSAKVIKAMNPGARIPPLDTHLGFALQFRAKATAHLLVEYAAKNQTTMKWLLAFNKAFTGSESATVLISLGLSAAGTLGLPAPPMLHGMFNADVMQAVEAENRELREEFAQIRRQQEAQKAAAREPAA